MNNNKEAILALVRQNGFALSQASQELQHDKEVVLAAMKQSGWALQKVCDALQNDKEVVLTAVQQNGWALRLCASEELKDDTDVVLAAVKQDGRALEFASERLRCDKAVVLAAVHENGMALEDASIVLKGDKETVIAAVSQNGLALAFATDIMRNDKEVVLAAVSQKGLVLEYASDALKADLDVVLAAIQQNKLAAGYARPFPQGQLSTEILNRFYPMIIQEVGKEISKQDTERTHRGTREYGYHYFKLEEGDFSFSPVPGFLSDLGQKICLALGHEAREFTNIILSVYEGGFHLEPHIDTDFSDLPQKRYCYGEDVYGLIIESDPTGHLYFIRDDVNLVPALDLPPIYSVAEKPGAIFCLQGAFRRAPYFHGVSKVSHRRISITFRTVHF